MKQLHKTLNALDGASSLHFVTEQVTPARLGIGGKAGSKRLVRKARAAMYWAQPVPVSSKDPSQNMADLSAKMRAPWGSTFQKGQRKPESGGRNKRSDKEQREHQGQR